MENRNVFCRSPLISELKQGYELTRRLWNQFEETSSGLSDLIQSIIESLEKAMSMATSSDFQGDPPVIDSTAETKSPMSSNGSPSNGTTESTLKHQEHNKRCKKRKSITPKWTNQVIVLAVKDIDGPPGDGFSWRKYGQKDILGAKHPRSYYRCTHHHSQGCNATKQVQKRDEDSTTIDVIYHGEHSCFRKQSWKQENTESNPDYQTLSNCKPSPSVKGLENSDSTSLTSNPTPIGHAECESYNIFSSPSTLDNQLMGSNCNSTFISQIKSQTNYFPLPPLSTEDTATNLNSSKSNLTNTISSMISNESMGFAMDPTNFNPDFLLMEAPFPEFTSTDLCTVPSFLDVL